MQSTYPLPVVPRLAVMLGLAGVTPQALCLALVVEGGEARWFGLAAGCCYAAVILSFLGGMWWMQAMMAGVARPWIYAMAVLASLSGWAAMLPWCVGWRWPGPELAVLGLLLLASPLVERAMAQHLALPAEWLQLRVVMATGLGLLTLLIAAG